MIPINDEKPEIGETVLCKVVFWRHGSPHHEEDLEAEYLGMNDAIGMPMFDIETFDEAYPEVTHFSRPAHTNVRWLT